jgi:hypothetical protein
MDNVAGEHAEAHNWDRAKDVQCLNDVFLAVSEITLRENAIRLTLAEIAPERRGLLPERIEVFACSLDACAGTIERVAHGA